MAHAWKAWRLDCLADGAGAGLLAVLEAGSLLRDGPLAEAMAGGRDDLGGEGLAAVLADDGLAAVLGAGGGNDVLLDMLVLAALIDDVVLAEDDCVLRDGELGTVRDNELALDAELAVDGNIAAQGDGHALGDA